MLFVASHRENERKAESALVLIVEAVELLEFVIGQTIEASALLLARRFRREGSLPGRPAGQIGMRAYKVQLCRLSGFFYRNHHCAMQNLDTGEGSQPSYRLCNPGRMLENSAK